MRKGDSSHGVQVEGYKELAKTLRKLKDEDLKREMVTLNRAAAFGVAYEASNYVPTVTYALFKSIRGTGTMAGAQARAGSKAVPYASIVHYGGNGITANPFMWRAANKRMGSTRALYEMGIPPLIQKSIERSTPTTTS